MSVRTRRAYIFASLTNLVPQGPRGPELLKDPPNPNPNPTIIQLRKGQARAKRPEVFNLRVRCCWRLRWHCPVSWCSCWSGWSCFCWTVNHIKKLVGEAGDVSQFIIGPLSPGISPVPLDFARRAIANLVLTLDVHGVLDSLVGDVVY